MSHGRAFDEPAIYAIRIQGVLHDQRPGWFDGFTIDPQANGETVLTGPVADQAALYGCLSKIRDLGMPLLSIKRLGGTK